MSKKSQSLLMLEKFGSMERASDFKTIISEMMQEDIQHLRKHVNRALIHDFKIGFKKSKGSALIDLE